MTTNDTAAAKATDHLASAPAELAAFINSNPAFGAAFRKWLRDRAAGTPGADSIPFLTNSGTAPESLIQDCFTATDALREARRALGETAPNARDYQGHPAELAAAMDEHTCRLGLLALVTDELNARAFGIDAAVTAGRAAAR